MRPWVRDKTAFFGFLSPACLWMTVFLLLPMLELWFCSFSQKTGFGSTALTWTLQNYARIFDPIYLKVFWHSTCVALVTAFVTLLVAVPASLAITCVRPSWQPCLLFLVVLPFWTSTLIRAYALIVILQTDGLLNTFLRKVFAFLHLPFSPFNFLYTNGAVIAGLVYMSLPLMILPLYLSFERVDKRYVEASLDLGAGRIRTFCRITLPLALPGILSGFVLTLVSALSAYLVPDFLGGVDSMMISNIISDQFRTADDWPFGSALSFTLMYLCLGFIAAKFFLSSVLRG